ncbi:MAG: hypothetical protein EA428_14490 [Spirochaetaceae bacterium]|nr:MAG: hypothetical protein EA428_14490 [Spirochaetaceae bacterium]
MKLSVEPLKKTLRAEIEALERVAELERLIRNAVMERDWSQLEKKLYELDYWSSRVIDAEEMRRDCLADFADSSYSEELAESESDVGVALLDILQLAPFADRTELTELYRQLKIAVMTVQSATYGLQSYVNAAAETTQAFLEELFPSHKGKHYSRNGSAASADRRALVLDHQL